MPTLRGGPNGLPQDCSIRLWAAYKKVSLISSRKGKMREKAKAGASKMLKIQAFPGDLKKPTYKTEFKNAYEFVPELNSALYGVRAISSDNTPTLLLAITE